MTAIRSNIPEKVLEESVNQFSADQNNTSELNLSISRHSPMVSKMEASPMGGDANGNNKDSVCFNIEPERERRKKGLGLASKMAKNEDEMIKISGNLTSK